MTDEQATVEAGEDLGPDEPTFDVDGMEGGPKTHLGFGGQTIPRKLTIGDTVYLLMRCDVVSDGRSRKKDDDGELRYKAGASTIVLAELDARDAAQVAADHG